VVGTTEVVGAVVLAVKVAVFVDVVDIVEVEQAFSTKAATNSKLNPVKNNFFFIFPP
jgi:hypothetical protein